MKINAINGEIDTDKLDDLSAETVHKANEFITFCFKNKIPALLSIMHPNKEIPKRMVVSSYRNEVEYLGLLNALNEYFEDMKDGLAIVKTSRIKDK